jgi:hypothetical protein
MHLRKMLALFVCSILLVIAAKGRSTNAALNGQVTAPGTYELPISKTGFRTMLRPDIILHVEDSRALNATLQVGDAVEIVRVKRRISLVNAETAEVSTTVDRNFAANFPLN